MRERRVLIVLPFSVQFEAAARRVATTILYPISKMGETQVAPDVQVTLRSVKATLTGMRELHADKIAHLVRVPGIVIGASTLASRATQLSLMCRNCKSTRVMTLAGGYGGFSLPRTCDGQTLQGISECGLDPFVIIHEKCKFADSQNVKLQEAPDMVPVGELPRHMLLSIDRNLCGRVVPGSRIVATGVWSTFQASKNGKPGNGTLRTPYLKVLGLEIDAEGAGGRGNQRMFSLAEEEEFRHFSRIPNLYEKYAASIAPSIFGNEGGSREETK